MRFVTRHSGFTLVEVVVSIGVLSLIMLATVTALRTFGQTYDRLLVATDRTSEVREVSRFLRHALRDTLDAPSEFLLRGGELSWVTPLDRVGSAGGLQHLRLSSRGDALVLSFATFDPMQPEEGEPEWGALVEDFVLVDALDEAKFEVKDTPVDDWATNYDGTASPTIPWAVRATISSDGITWPPIVVTLHNSTVF